ncbi:hypothetical protein [Persicimonas caeni]|uniref:hypothetical protein n=1 Tax=Persicimonas caeni TaxID=2292766 RepID=UPI00143D6A3D|nr:hypothetical protein [Persicimonas caeni]
MKKSEEEKKSEAKTAKRPASKSYTPPELTAFGQLRHLILGSSGFPSDGGDPAGDRPL